MSQFRPDNTNVAASGNQGIDNRSGNFSTQEAPVLTNQPVTNNDQRLNNATTSYALSDRLSTRYDSYKGILGNAQDMRASLILNTIEDKYRGNTGRMNLRQEFFNDDSSSAEYIVV